LPGRGQTDIDQQLVGQLFIAGYINGDMPGFGSNRRLNPFLIMAVTKLDQAALIQTQPGDIPLLGRLDQPSAERALGNSGGKRLRANFKAKSKAASPTFSCWYSNKP
jgi:hypothetical protein